MNYTQNYHLPQWEETDRVMRTDFNKMCADMEAGLTGNAAAAATAKTRADKGVSDAAAAQSAANTAQATADTAVSKADAAQSTANAAQTKANAAYSPSKPPYTIGSYTGDGKESKAIYLGFKPRFVIVSAQTPTGQNVGPILFTILAGEGVMTTMLSFQTTGFTILAPNGQFPAMNQNNRLYTYIAFR